MKNILLQNISDINTLEEAILELARQMMGKAIMELEEELFKRKGKELESIRFVKRTISTKVGNIDIRRRLYKDKETGENIYLLDKKLGLRKRKRVSGGYLKLLVTLANKMTYRQVEEVLDEAGFPHLSHETVFNEVRAFGERESERIKREKDEIFTEGKYPQVEEKEVPLLFIEADGIMVGSQEKEKERIEIKFGLIHEGWEFTSPTKKRKKLKEPQIVAGVYNKVEDFYEELSYKVSGRYNLEDTTVVLNGDGASWIQQTSKEYFPGLIVQLDRYHIKKDISLYFGREVAEGLCKVLADGRKRVFLDTLESLVCEGETVENRIKRQSLVNHFKKYEEHLLDYRYKIQPEIKKDNLYGMGAVESYVGKNVARRMKNQGMSWSIKGADAMVRILMLKHNKELKKRLEDKYYKIVNPIKKIRYKIKKEKRDWSSWLQVKMPVFDGPDSGKDWVVKGLKELATV
jgi:hypothetical protein